MIVNIITRVVCGLVVVVVQLYYIFLHTIMVVRCSTLNFIPHIIKFVFSKKYIIGLDNNVIKFTDES